MAHPLYELLRKLEDAHIHYTLGRHREDTVLVTLTLVGERVEVDVFDDGHMEVSRFPGSEDIVGGQELSFKRTGTELPNQPWQPMPGYGFGVFRSSLARRGCTLRSAKP